MSIAFIAFAANYSWEHSVAASIATVLFVERMAIFAGFALVANEVAKMTQEAADEYYDEEHFRFDSSIRVASQTDLLVIVGTSGATSLPAHVASLANEYCACILDINIEKNPFSELAINSPGGDFIQSSASDILPRLAKICPV